MLFTRDLTDKQPLAWVKELLMQQPNGRISRDWVGFPNVIQAVQELFAEHVARPPAAPPWPVNRGIVIAGGGWKFFPSVYVSVRVIRHVGCTLPIQVWYLGDAGEFNPKMAEVLDEYDVGWIDGNSWWRENPTYRIRLNNIDHGWMLKPFAVLGCPFREVLYLDADCYPAINPTPFLDSPEVVKVGAVFWPDRKPLEPGQWDRFGAPRQNWPGLESGQFFVDKFRHWRALWGACFLNAMHDFTWAHVYGDKDTFGIAWSKAGHPLVVPSEQPGFRTHTFVQVDFAGKPLFLHRTQDKFRLLGSVAGEGIASDYATRQAASTNQFDPALPHEQFCFDVLQQLDEDLRPDKNFDLLGHRSHIDIWERINRQNEYRFARSYLASDVCLDIGANLGAAAHTLLRRGIGHVVCVEPLADAMKRCRANLSRWSPRVHFIQAAAWSAPRGPERLRIFRHKSDPANTTIANAFSPCEVFEDVPTVSIDGLITTAIGSPAGRLRLLKIDAEGAEYPTLLTSTMLDRVDEIVGEWHVNPDIQIGDGNGIFLPCDREMLVDCLEDWRFEVHWEQFAETHGLFWARRRSAPDPSCCP